MLENTFCHIPRVSLRTEEKLWSAGMHKWDSVLSSDTIPVARVKKETLQKHLDDSIFNLQRGNPYYFAKLLPPNLHWRLFPDFRDSIAYIDIETTGMSGWEDRITSIALYDGDIIRTYIQGINLDDFKRDIRKYDVLVTYNGKCFDVPFLRNVFKMQFKQVHIDLRFLLHGLGFSGGLKSIEKQTGISRGELDGIDGYMAVLLWHDYNINQNPRALETLVSYNIQDVLSLEILLVKAYNLKLKDTPFARTRRIPKPIIPEIPFQPDRKTVNRLKREYARHFG
jgi:uncharacterized protein YprB with RNaseH-like and TPR domain